MARARKTRKSSGGRGSAEAIEKRRVARHLNSLLTGGSKQGAKLDGRTEKRRARLLKELKDGRSGRELKPIDFLSHVNELLELGETVASIKKHGVKPRRTDGSSEVLEAAKSTQEAYGFRAEAWKLMGIDIDQIGAATKKGAAKRGTRKRKGG